MSGRRVVPVLAVLMMVSVMGTKAVTETAHALLVGVSDYSADLVQYAPALEGPANDVALMYRSFLRLGFTADHITVLADGQPHDTYRPLPYTPHAPTRDAILSELARLSHSVEAGDLVAVFLAGHGSQITETVANEADQLDEIYLPADFDIRRGDAGPILINPIRDDELGLALEAITGQGAHVWLIVDACHAGSFERGFARLTPRVMPLPVDAPLVSLTDLPDFAPKRQNAPNASFAGFYASASDQLAVEGNLAGSPDGPVHGLFTWTLSRALGQSHGLRDLSRVIRAEYWSWGMTLPDPVFAGDLTVPVPGLAGDGSTYALQFKEGVAEVEAGLINGFDAGDILAIEDGAEDPVLFARVTHADLTDLKATIIKRDPAWPDRLDERLIRDGLPVELRKDWLSDRAPILSARLAEPATQGRLRVALPQLRDGAPALAERLDRFEFVAGDERPDLTFSLSGGNLIADWAGGQPVVLGPADRPSDWEAPLARLVRAATILKGAHSFAQMPAADALQVEVGVWPQPAQSPCAAPATKQETPLPAQKITPCDTVVLNLYNDGPDPLDIAPFYLGVDAGLYYLSGYPRGSYLGLRLAPGQSETVIYAEDPGETGGGRMFLVVLAETVADLETAPRDLRGLARPAPALRSGSGSRFAQWFGRDPGPALRSAGERSTNRMGAVILPVHVTESD